MDEVTVPYVAIHDGDARHPLFGHVVFVAHIDDDTGRAVALLVDPARSNAEEHDELDTGPLRLLSEAEHSPVVMQAAATVFDQITLFLSELLEFVTDDEAVRLWELLVDVGNANPTLESRTAAALAVEIAGTTVRDRVGAQRAGKMVRWLFDRATVTDASELVIPVLHSVGSDMWMGSPLWHATVDETDPADVPPSLGTALVVRQLTAAVSDPQEPAMGNPSPPATRSPQLPPLTDPQRAVVDDATDDQLVRTLRVAVEAATENGLRLSERGAAVEVAAATLLLTRPDLAWQVLVDPTTYDQVADAVVAAADHFDGLDEETRDALRVLAGLRPGGSGGGPTRLVAAR